MICPRCKQGEIWYVDDGKNYKEPYECRVCGVRFCSAQLQEEYLKQEGIYMMSDRR